MTVYDEITEEIMNLKMAKGKVFKPILILSLLDYYKDINQPEETFNTMTDVKLLVPYYKKYLSYPPILKTSFNHPSNHLSDANLLLNIRRNPLRALHPSNFFKNNDPRIPSKDGSHYTVKDSELPTTFMIEIDESINNYLMIQVIRIACYRLIFKTTGIALSENTKL